MDRPHPSADDADLRPGPPSSGLSRRQAMAGLAAGSGATILSTLGCAQRPDSRGRSAADPARLDLPDAARAVRAGSISPVDLTQACLERIARLDPSIDSFITVTAEQALDQARQAEYEVAMGRWRGPLHGIPIALKDNIDTAGVRTTAASAVFAGRVPGADAEVVARLRAGGAVFLGKLNMHEFALGTTSAVSHWGPVHNPWDLERVAGGSSGGCGAALAAGLCFGAVGTDTGGSVRIPAACCGVVGFKPTYGVVSARGTVPISTSFDHVGPMGRTVAGTAAMFRAMTEDPVALEFNPRAPPSVSRMRVGVLRIVGEVCDVPVDPEVQAVFDTAVALIRSLVAEVRDAELPMPDLGSVIDTEAHAYHAEHLAATPELYDPRTRDGLISERQLPASEAVELRRQLARHRVAIGAAFSSVDVVVLPTLPVLPILIRDAVDPFAMPACTFAFSLGGLPAISIPCGFSQSGLPIGLLIGGPPLGDARVLALAQAYESATEWHRRRPAGFD